MDDDEVRHWDAPAAVTPEHRGGGTTSVPEARIAPEVGTPTIAGAQARWRCSPRHWREGCLPGMPLERPGKGFCATIGPVKYGGYLRACVHRSGPG